MKKLIIAAVIFTAVSCSKSNNLPTEAHISANLVYLFNGAAPTPQATSDIYLPGDSVTMEYAGHTYKTGIIFKQLPNDESIKIVSAEDKLGVKLIW